MRIVVALGGNALLQARRADDRRAPARQRPDRGAGARPVADASTSSSSRTATARRSACSRCRARPTRMSRPTRSTSSAPRPQGMIGYLVEQELGNLLPIETPARDAPDHGRGRSRRPGVRRPDQVRRPDLRRGRGATALAAEKGWVVKPDGDAAGGASCRRPGRSGSSRSGRCAGCSTTAPSSSAPAAVASRRCTCPASERQLVGRRGGHRQGPRQQPARARARGGPVRDGDRRRRRLRATGARRASARIDRVDAGRARARWTSPAGSMGPKVEAAAEFVERDRQAGGDRLARATSTRSSTAAAGHSVVASDRIREGAA